MVGYNVFAYCANNPINYVDLLGEDAIWLQDKDEVVGFGHTGLLIQDDKGVWYHFYWGNTGTGIFGKQKVTATLQKLTGFKYDGLSSLNDYLIKHGIYTPSDKKDTNGNPYEDAIYIKGDFTASVKYADRLTRDYNLITNNCVQLSIEVLLRGRFAENHTQYKSVLRDIRSMPIPNCAYLLLRFNNYITRWFESI